MSFTEYIFFPLFLIYAAIYFVTPKKAKWFILLAGGIGFYCTYGPELLPFAIGACLVAWVGGIAIGKRYEKFDAALSPEATKEEKAKHNAKAKKGAKYILWLTVALMLLALVFVKTQSWLMPKLFGEGVIPVLVPLGISYYTMSLVAYLADTYWRKTRAEKNVFKLLTFTMFFPKLLEGPIARYQAFEKQLSDPKGFDYTAFCHGLQRMLWGYFKKLCIADRLSVFVNTVYDGYKTEYGSMLLLATVFAAFSLYCDFSGCIDIALGASESLGIKLEENFKQPFFSESAAEFWRRWHITLGTWFKDYIYMPIVINPRMLKISGSIGKKNKRAGKAFMAVIPLLIVWLLTGIWHGTGINYIIWGLYWGVLIIISTVWAPELKKLMLKVTGLLKIDPAGKGYTAFKRLRTFVLYLISRMIVLSGSIMALGVVIKRQFVAFGPWKLVDKSVYKYGLDRPNFWLGVLLIVFLVFIESKQNKGVNFREEIDKKNIVVRWAFYLFAIFFVLIFGMYGGGYDAAGFVYMNY